MTTVLHRRLAALVDERREMVRQLSRGRLSDEELDEELTDIDAERCDLEHRLAALWPRDDERQAMDRDLLEQLRSRLDAGLTPEQRQEIVRLLVARITIATTIGDDGTKDAHAKIDYRLPAVVESFTVTRASLEYTRLQREVTLPPSGRWPWRVAA